jgi:hypothetical protein
MMTAGPGADWAAVVERCIADSVVDLGRRRPDLHAVLLSDVTDSLRRIAREVFPWMAATAELTPVGAAVLREILSADRPPLASSPTPRTCACRGGRS